MLFFLFNCIFIFIFAVACPRKNLFAHHKRMQITSFASASSFRLGQLFDTLTFNIVFSETVSSYR